MLNPRPRLLPVCIAAALLSGPAAAIGIGDIHLRSFLGAPLQAEVPLNHIDDLTADQLKVQIGSQSDYSTLGVDYSYLHTQLKIEPIIKNGQGYVRITTREPISEPYLNFVLNLHWPQGQLVREFTVLLDPAPIAPTAVASANQLPSANQPEAKGAVAASETATASEPHQLELPMADTGDLKPTPKSKARHPVDRHLPTGTYVTQPGDSLWRVANKLRPTGVSTEQMMQALYAANPQAFIKGDTARLKAVVPLTAPTAEQIAAAGGATPAVTATAQAQTVASSSQSVAARSEAVMPAGDVGAATDLRQENAVLKTQVTELTGNVATLNESLAQSEQRLHQLESQLNDLLVQFQQQRATVAALSGAAAETRATANVVPANGSMISQVNASDLHPAPRAHTPWWVHLLYWLGIGGAAMIAVREHFWPRRLATATIGAGDAVSPLERTAVPAGNNWRSAEENARYWHHADPIDAEVPPEEIVAVPVASDEPELSHGHDDPVDASISAGVFVAFGRFDEAERLLLQAIEQAPDRTDLQLQLLDVYSQADRAGAFEALAADIERDTDNPEVIAELAVLRENFVNKR